MKYVQGLRCVIISRHTKRDNQSTPTIVSTTTGSAPGTSASLYGSASGGGGSGVPGAGHISGRGAGVSTGGPGAGGGAGAGDGGDGLAGAKCYVTKFRPTSGNRLFQTRLPVSSKRTD